MFVAVSQKKIPASLTQTWRYLTEPTLLSQWFADADWLKAAESFRFDFGDGDFFSGTVLEWDEPTCLRLKWKFMGIGPQYEIQFRLSPLAQETELNVQDSGAITQEEAEGLRDGWRDFLSRLEKLIRLGKRTRYEWSQEINMAALLPYSVSTLSLVLERMQWWQASFPSINVVLNRSGDQLALKFRTDGWEDVETEALIRIEQSATYGYLEVNHKGWTKLPPEKQISERRRFAELWRNALYKLENPENDINIYTTI